MEIDIHQTNPVAFLGKAQSQVDSDGRFADPALAAHHQNFIFDFSQGLGDGDFLLSQAGIA
jgi:hypothetical protein